MRLTRTSKPQTFLYQIVPLLDVIFALLVFFILSSTFIFQPGIAVHPPASTFAMEPARNPLILSIVGENVPKPRLFFRDQLLAESSLKQVLAEPALKGRMIILKADRSTPYDMVMRIANQAVASGFEVALAAETAKP